MNGKEKVTHEVSKCDKIEKNRLLSRAVQGGRKKSYKAVRRGQKHSGENVEG